MITSYLDWAIIAMVVYGYAIVSARLKNSPFSGALLFLLTGLVLGPHVLGWMSINVGSESLRTIAEFTLALILFTDASRTDLPVLGRSRGLPIRLLGIGLPLTILFGTVLARLLFPSLSGVEAALLSVILAPTDAALGQPVVSNPLVPSRIREDLSAESGLNDGICVPFLLTLLALTERSRDAGSSAQLLGGFFLQQVGLALVVGLAIALLGCWLRNRSCRSGSIAPDWQPLLDVALPVACFTLAQQLGGSGFIACFSAGLLYGGLTPQPQKEEELVAAEATGDVLSLISWVAFGSAVVVIALKGMTLAAILYALLSLTLVRMLAVAIATTGLRLPPPTTLFLGWFGPRGLASIVFAVMVLDAGLPHSSLIASVAAITILFSVVAHGLSAPPLVRRYARALGPAERS